VRKASKKRTRKETKPSREGIPKALRRPPLVGIDLNLVCPVVAGRKVDIPEAVTMAEWLERTKQSTPIASKETAVRIIRELRDDG
jgi:hypothetical protein